MSGNSQGCRGVRGLFRIPESYCPNPIKNPVVFNRRLNTEPSNKGSSRDIKSGRSRTGLP